MHQSPPPAGSQPVLATPAQRRNAAFYAAPVEAFLAASDEEAYAPLAAPHWLYARPRTALRGSAGGSMRFSTRPRASSRSSSSRTRRHLSGSTVNRRGTTASMPNTFKPRSTPHEFSQCSVRTTPATATAAESHPTSTASARRFDLAAAVSEQRLLRVALASNARAATTTTPAQTEPSPPEPQKRLPSRCRQTCPIPLWPLIAADYRSSTVEKDPTSETPR
jgi:hypothetical protein